MSHDHAHHMSHDDVLATALDHLGPVLEESPDGVYLYVDDDNRACNERMAKLFGHTTESWATAGNFLASFVAEGDRERFAQHYHERVAMLSRPVTFQFEALRADGTTFTAETDMVPLCIAGHPVAYHFVREISR